MTEFEESIKALKKDCVESLTASTNYNVDAIGEIIIEIGISILRIHHVTNQRLERIERLLINISARERI